jgi:alanine racemase
VIRQTVAHVDLEAIESNFRAIADFLNTTSRSSAPSAQRPAPAAKHSAPSAQRPAPRIIAVVKANAYGHGAPQVALALERAGAAMLACADIEEAIVLREAGLGAPILVFGALSVSDLDGIFAHDLTPTISTPGAARA